MNDFEIVKLRPVLESMDQRYTGRAMGITFINVNWLFLSNFRITNLWVSQSTQDRISIYSNDQTFEALNLYLTEEEIEMKYGGTKLDISTFFPPIY